MEKIDIKKITVDDIDQLQKIGKQTFYETFSTYNTDEDMQKYVTESFSVAQLNTELNNENSEFYFAEINKKTVGYLKLNYGISQTELKDDKTLEIERIYVLKGFHGKKIGQILCDQAINIAKQKNVDFIWLGVWGENLKAIHFYKKNGFVEFDKHIFKLGDKEQTDMMMKLKLKNDY
ncbi:GNAT family N-acetyltransferase [Chryseobacterium sp.]|uniref:GNAT family N-acetyltransferase n=1 Tax=Chryseobacterium sp. TaxID=1871047 RepID=UPI000ECB862B|nr:GNAT family N-acetyltransferase [Chryseobacterium sp.]HCA07175.1 GNAT family N-acetyltransferase [Chryseobacterium sp.]